MVKTDTAKSSWIWKRRKTISSCIKTLIHTQNKRCTFVPGQPVDNAMPIAIGVCAPCLVIVIIAVLVYCYKVKYRYTKSHLLSVLCMVLYNFYLLLFHSVSTPMCFCSSLDLVFLCFVIVSLLIAMSCHCPLCVRLSHSIKDYLLTYLLTTEENWIF